MRGPLVQSVTGHITLLINIILVLMFSKHGLFSSFSFTNLLKVRNNLQEEKSGQLRVFEFASVFRSPLIRTVDEMQSQSLWTGFIQKKSMSLLLTAKTIIP